MESEINNSISNNNNIIVESKLRCTFNPKLHFICHQPVVLKCQPETDGYSTSCLECVSQKVDYTGKFKCPLCDNEHRKDDVVEKSKTSYQEEIDEYEKTLKSNLKIAFHLMLSKAKKLHSQINEKISPKNKNYVIRNTIEFFEHTMLVRVESLKFEMEKMERRAKKRIERFRSTRKRSHSDELVDIDKKFQILRATKSGVDVLRAFEMLMLNLSSLNERFTYEDFNSTSSSKINRTLNSYQQYCLSNHIKTASKKNSLPNRSILGFLSGYNPLNELKNDIELKLEVIYLGKQLKSCCGIAELFGASKNHQIAMTDYSSNSIKVLSKYDSYEMTDLEIEEIEMFRLVKFKNFYAICTDFDETSLMNTDRSKPQMNLFICDMDLNRVLIYDFGIRKLKRIITGTLSEDGKFVDEFECPRDICYYDGTIYVLDQVKNSIDIFKSSGDYLRSFYFNSDYFTGRHPYKLVEDPLSVRVNLNTIAIIDWKKSVMLFDLEFNVRGSIEQFNLMSMCLVSDGLNASSLKIFLHSQSGEFIGYRLFTDTGSNFDSSFDPQPIVRRKFDDLRCSSEFMIYSLASKTFILTLGWSKSIALIRF